MNISSSEYIILILFVLVLILHTAKSESISNRYKHPPPYVLEVPDFLSDHECDSIVSASMKKGLEESHVSGFRDEEPAYLDKNARKSTQTWFSKGSHPDTDKMLSRTKHFLKMFDLDPESFEYEDVQVARYLPGGYYKHHFDGDDCTDSCPKNQRIATMLVYLKEPIEGGETDFPELKKIVKPRKGSAVFFWVACPKTRKLFKQTLHSGTPVKHGEKMIATQWVRTK